MRITLLTVGKTAFPFVEEGNEMYEKRISHYANYRRIEIPELNFKPEKFFFVHRYDNPI